MYECAFIGWFSLQMPAMKAEAMSQELNLELPMVGRAEVLELSSVVFQGVQ